MRRFFRFSIRDLLWLTLLAAVALGWYVRERVWLARERQLQGNIHRAHDDVTLWRQAAGGLESAVAQAGWKVRWDMSRSRVYIDRAKPGGYSPGRSDFFREPTQAPSN